MTNPNKLKKNKKRFFKRPLFIVLALLVEIIVFILLLVFCAQYFLVVRTICSVLVLLLCIRVVISKSTPSYKIIWLLFLCIFPLMGLMFYIFLAEDKFTFLEKKKIWRIIKEYEKVNDSKYLHSQLDNIDRDKDPECYNIANYISSTGLSPVFTNTKTTYFAWGEDAFPVMIEKLKKAKHYIFMEYFILAEGIFWNSILEVLKEKVKEGLDVRVMYDDLGCIGTLPGKYYKTLESFGIKTIKYAPLRPFIDVRMNNRDHRKILVIDGYVGFTGGINIADEYINEKVRFGRWKDNCIMLEGAGVFGLTTLFLSSWSMLKNDYSFSYEDYLPAVYAKESEESYSSKGYVQPYGCVPFTYESVGQNVYIDICIKAKKYLYITTPYLILDDQMEAAICLAAKNGVDVRLITPHIPDKKMVFELTRSHYRSLLEAGVKIYEYTPGFIHAKTFLADDIMATVGTINLDYRSLYLHMENGVFLYKESCLKDIKDDFENTFLVSEERTMEMENKIKWYRRAIRAILKIFAPLM